MIKTNVAPHFPPTRSRTQQPVVTGTSVLAVRFKDGVMMTADTLGSYGRMSRFRDIQRLVRVGETTLLGASGDLSDFQAVKDMLERRRIDDVCADDGATVDSGEVLSFLSRVLYQRRNKMNPLWNDLIIAGPVEDRKGNKKIVLGVVDKIGTVYEDNFIATGFGAHLALPLIRERWKPNMSRADAATLLDDCMRVLYYRDCRTVNKIQRATVDADGEIEVTEPYVLKTEWAFESFVNPKAGAENGGSW